LNPRCKKSKLIFTVRLKIKPCDIRLLTVDRYQADESLYSS
jgi:hypothetical protein